MKVRPIILLRFPGHAVSVSESIKGNLHQISLFPVDKPVLASSGGTCRQLKSQLLLQDTCLWAFGDERCNPCCVIYTVLPLTDATMLAKKKFLLSFMVTLNRTLILEGSPSRYSRVSTCGSCAGHKLGSGIHIHWQNAPVSNLDGFMVLIWADFTLVTPQFAAGQTSYYRMGYFDLFLIRIGCSN